jgi:hypothetical protein
MKILLWLVFSDSLGSIRLTLYNLFLLSITSQISGQFLQWVGALATIVERASSHSVVCHGTVQDALYY